MRIPGAVGARAFQRVVLFIGCCLVATLAQAQKLTVQGDRFAIDGTPKFLTFISYFGAMGAPNVIQDLHLLRTLGFDGARIWPNLDTGPQLMNGDGSGAHNDGGQQPGRGMGTTVRRRFHEQARTRRGRVPRASRPGLVHAGVLSIDCSHDEGGGPSRVPAGAEQHS